MYFHHSTHQVKLLRQRDLIKFIISILFFINAKMCKSWEQKIKLGGMNSFFITH